jgi:hypothetical protein
LENTNVKRVYHDNKFVVRRLSPKPDLKIKKYTGNLIVRLNYCRILTVFNYKTLRTVEGFYYILDFNIIGRRLYVLCGEQLSSWLFF